MSISIKIPRSQIDKVAKAFSAYSTKVDARVKKAKAITAINIQREAKGLAPVKTGSLRSSVAVGTSEDGELAVGTNVEYAVHQEFGTRFQKGTAFLFPAAESERADHRKRMEDALKP